MYIVSAAHGNLKRCLWWRDLVWKGISSSVSRLASRGQAGAGTRSMHGTVNIQGLDWRRSTGAGWPANTGDHHHQHCLCVWCLGYTRTLGPGGKKMTAAMLVLASPCPSPAQPSSAQPNPAQQPGEETRGWTRHKAASGASTSHQSIHNTGDSPVRGS